MDDEAYYITPEVAEQSGFVFIPEEYLRVTPRGVAELKPDVVARLLDILKGSEKWREHSEVGRTLYPWIVVASDYTPSPSYREFCRDCEGVTLSVEELETEYEQKGASRFPVIGGVWGDWETALWFAAQTPDDIAIAKVFFSF